MIALHITAARRDSVSFNRLTVESLAGGSPIFQGAGFEIEIERFAVFTDRSDARRHGGQSDADSEEEQWNKCGFAFHKLSVRRANLIPPTRIALIDDCF